MTSGERGIGPIGKGHLATIEWWYRKLELRSPMPGPTILKSCLLGLVAASAIATVAAADLPAIDSTTLGTRRRLPWSEPVQIDDPFEGRFVGVFDRHFFFDRFLETNVRIEVQSLWGPDSVRFVSIIRDRDCFGRHARFFSSSGCSEFSNTRNLVSLLIKLDDEVIQVTGRNSLFPVSPDLARVLLAAPKENISIRLIAESGETIDSQIGAETVEAWGTVYASQATGTDGAN